LGKITLLLYGENRGFAILGFGNCIPFFFSDFPKETKIDNLP
jgi:hypothetical protein